MTRRGRWLIAAAFSVAATACLVLLGREEAARMPAIRHFTLSYPARDCAPSPARIVLIADLHLRPREEKRLRAIVGQVDALRPDVVLLAGDFFAGGGARDEQATRAMLAPLAGLHPREATLAVLGNNDWHDGPAPIARGLAAAHVVVLGNDAWLGRGIAVLGIEEITSNTANPVLARERLDTLLARAHRRVPPLLVWMAHNPVMFDRIPDGRGLMVAGHTHGGQVWPGITVPVMRWVDGVSLWLATRFGWSAGRYVRGVYGTGGWRMIVTSGVGTSGPPIRLDVPPEIVAIDLAGRAVDR